VAKTRAPLEGVTPPLEAEGTFAPSEPAAKAHSEYTQQLLAAKTRAIEQLKRRSVSTKDKEKS